MAVYKPSLLLSYSIVKTKVFIVWEFEMYLRVKTRGNPVWCSTIFTGVRLLRCPLAWCFTPPNLQMCKDLSEDSRLKLMCTLWTLCCPVNHQPINTCILFFYSLQAASLQILPVRAQCPSPPVPAHRDILGHGREKICRCTCSSRCLPPFWCCPLFGEKCAHFVKLL